jgi:hypothetical protein
MNKADLPYPMFTSLTVDGHKITATAKDATEIRWIANGEVISKKELNGANTLDLDTIKGAEDFQYVRAEIYGEGGLCISQALVIDDGSEDLKFVEEEKSFIDNLLAILKGTKIWTLIMEIKKAL